MAPTTWNAASVNVAANNIAGARGPVGGETGNDSAITRRQAGALDWRSPMEGHTRANPTWWDHQRHSLIRLRRQIEHELDARLRPHAGDVVVDMGCGDMPYRPLFEARGARYVGCDIDSAAQVQITPGMPIALDDACASLVVSFQVLEHVWDLGWYLAECRRLLRPGGALLLSTHGTWLYHPHPTDFRRWTQDGLVKEIEAHGFTVERITGLMGPLAWTTQFRLLGYREVLRRIPLLGALVLPFLIALMNVRMELEDAITPAAIRQTNACVYVIVARPRTSHG
jgi:SAM-dependent methyltransferase